MKKFFLAAVALSALCSSCETADESFLKETKNETVITQMSTNLNSTDYQTYKSIVASFVYTIDQSYTDNLKRFEQHVNLLMPNNENGEFVYEAINYDDVTLLENANELFINELTFSPAFKEALYNQLYKAEQPLEPLASETENQLLRTLFTMHNDNNGDEDDKWKNRRTIAFAYGAQYSLKQAVLYAGAIELRAFKLSQ